MTSPCLVDVRPHHSFIVMYAKVDYKPGQPDEEVKAIFVGRALVRGTKAYLDVMEPGWRQYTPEPQQPLINSVNMVSGCHEHANQYWVYLIDSRQALAVLNNEPRFLSITPDTALVDLEAAETDDAVRIMARREIQRQQKTDHVHVAIPIVVATYYHSSFVPSPPIATHADGTNVTNFSESLALWAKVNDADRTTTGCNHNDEGTQECASSEHILAAQTRYWSGIRKAIREAEVNRLASSEWKANGPPYACQRVARMGVGVEHARINYPFQLSDIVSMFEETPYRVDLHLAKITTTVER